MCGLVGMAGNLTFRHRAVMKTLLFFNTLRGKDSTGVTTLDTDKRLVETKKATIPGYEFIQMPNIDSLLSPIKGVWLGHGRAQTVGSISRVNAHPFEVRDDEDRIELFGAHNGTLRNKYDIEKLLNDERFGTDSEALMHLIARKGIAKAIKEVEGAYAITWWDSGNNSINFIRNKERPLCYAFEHDSESIIWASEPWMLRIACLREDLKLKETDKGEPMIYGVQEDTHIWWELPSFKHSDGPDGRHFGTPRRKGGLLGKPEKKYFPATGNYGATGKWYNDGERDQYDLGTLVARSAGGAVEKAEKKTTEADKAGEEKAEGKAGGRGEDGDVVGFEGQKVSRQFVNELIRQGCDFCQGPVNEDGWAWLDEMSIACRRCLKGDHIHVDVEEGKIKERVLHLVGGKAVNG